MIQNSINQMLSTFAAISRLPGKIKSDEGNNSPQSDNSMKDYDSNREEVMKSVAEKARAKQTQAQKFKELKDMLNNDTGGED